MRCIIVDDEFPSREELKHFLGQYMEIDIAGEFDDPLKALGFLQENSVDVVFLDINMPNLDGMSLGKLISKFKKSPQIIFITAYDSYAVEAFGIRAFDYIMKPYSEERIKDTLDRLTRSEGEPSSGEKEVQQQNKLTLWKGDKMFVLPLKDISFCEACERETKIFTPKGVYMSKLKISDLEEKLPKGKFFRSHRSYIVNLDKIVEIIPWFNTTYNLKLRDIDEKIPVSRSKVKEFKNLMGIG